MISKILCVCCAFLYLMATALEAFDNAPRCYQDLERNFFQPGYVSEALSMHRVPQSIWSPIIQALQQNTKDLPDRIRKAGKSMNPDPFDPEFLAEPALDLLTQSLYQIFVGVVADYNRYQDIVINGDDVLNMFTYIKDKQKAKFEGCFPGVEQK